MQHPADVFIQITGQELHIVMEFPVGVGKFGRTVISGCRQPGGGVQISAGRESLLLLNVVLNLVNQRFLHRGKPVLLQNEFMLISVKPAFRLLHLQRCGEPDIEFPQIRIGGEKFRSLLNTAVNRQRFIRFQTQELRRELPVVVGFGAPFAVSALFPAGGKFDGFGLLPGFRHPFCHGKILKPLYGVSLLRGEIETEHFPHFSILPAVPLCRGGRTLFADDGKPHISVILSVFELDFVKKL